MVAQYSQWDGYLEGQGWDILQFLLVPGNIQRLKAGMEFITILEPEKAQKLLENHSYESLESDGYVCQCGAVRSYTETSKKCFPPTLSRDTGSKVFDIIASAKRDNFIPFSLSLEFATDVLFCEYCYCVDLDRDTFELFGGHVKYFKSEEDGQQIGKFRFACVSPDADWIPHCLKSFSFDDLPKDLDDMLAKVKDDNPSVEYEKSGDEDNEEEDEKNDDEELNDDEEMNGAKHSEEDEAEHHHEEDVIVEKENDQEDDNSGDTEPTEADK